MLKKNEVYVTVDSPKVAKKLKKVLDMFGENTYDDEVIQDALIAGGNVHFWNKLSWAWGNSSDKNKVTVSELKQILFREHAKEGDVVIVDNGKFGSRWVLELTGNDIASFEHSNSFDLKTGENDFCKFGNSIAGGKFIRYATEEEKSLLNPKKQLEVGKWYKHANGEYKNWVVFNNGKESYGFNTSGSWFEKFDCTWYFNEHSFEEATKEEVESALRKEAEKRGLVGGVKISPLFKSSNKHYTLDGDYANYYVDKNRLYVGGILVFHDGKWAERLESLEVDFEFVINGDDIRASLDRVKGKMEKLKVSSSITDKDISIIERLHDTILENHGYSIHSAMLTDARQLAEKLRKLL